MSDAIYHVQIENGISKHFIHCVICYLQILYSFVLITKETVQSCLYELALHDQSFYTEIIHQKPISDKIKFWHIENNFKTCSTLSIQIADLKKEIEKLKQIRDNTIDLSKDDFLPSNLFFKEASQKVHIHPHLRTYSQAYRDICTASYILGGKSYCF